MKSVEVTIRENLVQVETIKCRLCGGVEYQDLFQADNIRRRAKRVFTLVRCASCNFKYFNPSPTEESLKYYYEEYFAHVPERIGILDKIYYFFLRNVRGNVKPGRLLDVGCANGKYLSFMKSRGWDVVGVDMANGCQFAREELKLKILDGQLWDHKFEDNSFDVITLWFVIEHIWDPIRLLKECHRILKPGGQIILSTLNSASVEAVWFKKYWWHLLAPEHLSQFDPKSFKQLMDLAGFKPIHLRQEPVTCGMIGSIQNWFDDKKISININNVFFKILFIPVDAVCAFMGRSGLITLYAVKKA